MAGKGSTVIIKRVKKGHAAAHGGSWKVAYADFVTAMMAFFLLMWLLSMSSEEKRARLAEYFKTFSIFEQSGTSFMEQSSSIKTDASREVQAVKEKTLGTTMMSPKALAEKLKIAVKEKLANLENRVLIEATEEGVRIQIIDPDGTLFPAGSAEPTKTLKDILKVVADNIKDMGNLIALEGHTDSSPYNVGRNTNWELSSSRASAARYLLNADGVDPDRIARVVGFADKHPYIENDPKDPRNRRISILVMQERLAKTETSPAEEQKPAPPPPGVNIIEPKMAPEDQDRMLKQMKEEQDRKAAAEKPKTEANRQWAADRREAPGALFKGTPFTPVIPGAGSQKTFKSAEKPSRMQIKEQPAVVPKAETQKGKEDPSAMRILEPKTPPGLNIIEPRKPQKQ